MVADNNFIGGTTLKWDTDVSGPAHTAYGLTMGSNHPNNVGGSVLESIRLQGPDRFTANPGHCPSAMGGVNVLANSFLRDVGVQNFGTAIGMGGKGQSYDHCEMEHIVATSVGYGMHFLPNSVGGGDLHFSHLYLSATLAAVGQASGSQGGGGSSWVGGGFYGPMAFHRYNDGLGGTGAAFLLSMDIIAFSGETNAHATAYDELWHDPVRGGKISDCTFSWGAAYAAADPAYPGWSGDFSVAGSSGTSLTLKDGQGFVFRPGMTVAGTGIPANTTVVGVTGSWPWSTVTLTLNKSVSGPQSVHVSQPYLGGLVAGSISNNHLSSKLKAILTTRTPVFASPVVLNNTIQDGSTSLSLARLAALSANPSGGLGTCYGNVYGSYGDPASLVLGSAPAHTPVAVGDLLMPAPGFGVQPCDGSRKPYGVAIRADSGTGAQGNIDYYVRASAVSHSSPTVHNRSSNTIAANALLKVDTAHPGGVTTASGPNDGWVIGINGTSAIPPNSTGAAAEIWL